MPRARNIKYGFFTNEHVVEVSYEARLLFIGTWCLADREGRLEFRPKKIKMLIFPADVISPRDITRLLVELQDHGLIEFYEVNKEQYIHVLGFKEHQRPHPNEKASDLPEPTRENTIKLDASGNYTSNPSDILIPDVLIPDVLNPSLAPPEPHAKKKSAQNWETDEQFLTLKLKYPPRTGSQRLQDACKALHARLKEGTEFAVIEAGVDRYIRYCEAAGINGTAKVLQMATFLGTNRCYLEPYSLPRSGAAISHANDDAIARAMGAS